MKSQIERLLTSFMASAAVLAAPGGQRARLSILIYHRVLAKRDPMRPCEVTRDEFRWQMLLLKQHFRVFSLSAAVRRLTEGTLPARSAVVTFDDGYADNVEVALPVLRELGLSATFFVTSGHVGNKPMWNDIVIEAIRKVPVEYLDLRSRGLGTYDLGDETKRATAATLLLAALKYLPGSQRQAHADYLEEMAAGVFDDVMMKDFQVCKLRDSGMEIGGHTVTHPILTSLPPSQARNEIVEGKEQLEALLGEPITSFAYPNGKPGQDYCDEHVRMVQEAGFSCAVSTRWGVSTQRTDLYQLQRFTPWDKSPLRFMARLVQNCLKSG